MPSCRRLGGEASMLWRRSMPPRLANNETARGRVRTRREHTAGWLMAANESWIYQGRQYHQWFGNGTSPKTGKPTAVAGPSSQLFLPVNAGQRVDYVAHGIIARVPANARTIWNRAVTESARDNLKTAVAGWYGGAGLSRGAFRARFLDPGMTLRRPHSKSASIAGQAFSATPVHVRRMRCPVDPFQAS